MASHIARRRAVASSAGSPMPANPAMPHTSAGPQCPSSERRDGLARVTAQHVGSCPEHPKEEIEHRDAAVGSENTGDQESDHRSINPQGLDCAVIRLETRAPTSYLSQHRSHQTQPEQQARESHLRCQIQIGVMRIPFPQLWLVTGKDLVEAANADPQQGVVRDHLQASLEDLAPLDGRLRCHSVEFTTLFAGLGHGLGTTQFGNTREPMPRFARNKYGEHGAANQHRYCHAGWPCPQTRDQRRSEADQKTQEYPARLGEQYDEE